MRLQSAPTLPIYADTRATLSFVRYVGEGHAPRPVLTLWIANDATYQSWWPYWRLPRPVHRG